ncbi:SRPBCC family protein [Paenibacillus macerans]|uniref:SRPBCC family protein n=1 Tax=Paenibacillus macerans TaxID=44252 RepID=UPI003D310C8E
MTTPIVKEIEIDAELELVWKAWIDEQRITLWFAPAAKVEPEIGGRFELFFDPSNKDRMGTKGCTILELEEPCLLVFEWKGPDDFETVMNRGDELTVVRVEFAPEGQGTKIRLVHSGWGSSPAWSEAKEWHEAAWDQVLGSLKSEMESGEGVLCCK